ncbi:MAG TPA: hypothetical protein VGO57_06490 [Verrucomicrobiae bacterium]
MGKIKQVFVFDAVGLCLNLSDRFAPDVQTIQLKPLGELCLRPAVSDSQFPNLRADKVS